VIFADDGTASHSRRQGHELHKQMVKATLNWRTARLHGLGQQIPVVTVDTRSDEAFLPMQGVQGISMCNVGVHGDWVSMLSKNEMLLDWLEDQLPEHRDDLAIVVDSADMIYGGCQVDELLTRYKMLSAVSGAPVIVSAELGIFPVDDRYQTHRYIEMRTRRHKVMNASGLHDGIWMNNSSGCLPANSSLCSRPTTYEFMNYGFIIGPVGDLHQLLNHVVRTVPPGFMDSLRGFLDPAKRVEEANDQGIAAMYMFDHPDIVALDYPMGLIASMHSMPNDMLSIRSGRIWNTVTEHEQCFAHFNGNSQPLLGGFNVFKKLGEGTTVT